jgi:hypothetical protein
MKEQTIESLKKHKAKLEVEMKTLLENGKYEDYKVILRTYEDVLRIGHAVENNWLGFK